MSSTAVVRPLFRRIEAHEISYSNLEDIICAFYGIKEYNIPTIMETSNDTVVETQAQKKELDKWQEETIEKVKLGKEPSWSLHDVMQDLCNNGLVPEGTIYVTVSW